MTTSAQRPTPHDGVPTDPIPPRELLGHTNALVLKNAQLEVAIFPALGRIGRLTFGGQDNVLRFDSDLARRAAVEEPSPDSWRNFGGDWIWPVSQARWAGAFGRHWPPQPFVDGMPWQGHAWRNDDDSQTCLLRLDIGAPLFITLTRRIHLDPRQARLTITQRAERTQPSEIPITLWNITQVAHARKVVIPVEATSRFENGYRVLDFGPPPDHIVDLCDGGWLAMDVMGGTEHKLGSDSPRGWIAAQRDGVLLIERAETRFPGGEFPDGGCRVEVYANSGLGYTEIETLSEERVLAPGDALENTLTLTLHRVAPDLSNCDLAARIRELVGEVQPAPQP